MIQSFSAYVAERYLKTRKKGAFVRVMMHFAKGGVALGVFVLLVTTALANGFLHEIQANLWSATSHFSVAHVWGDLPDTEGTLAKIRAVPGVAAATPVRQDFTLIRANVPGASSGPMLVMGVDPRTARTTASIFESLRPKPVEGLKDGEMLIGDAAAERYGIRLGQEVVLTFPREDVGLGGAMPRFAVFQVAGLFHSRISEYDSGWGFITIEDSKRIGESSQANYIGVRVRNLDEIDSIKPKILAALGQTGLKGPYTIPDLREQNRMLFAAMKVQKWIFTVILSLIVLVATFNIVSSLVLLITEKRRDLGVLLSMGATPAQIQRTFELQGIRIAAVGTLWGIGIGVPFCLLADHYKFVKLPPAAYDFITYLPFRLEFLDVVAVTIFPLLVAWWASRYPARRAASVDPVDALRAE
jgi:lipoprotein-releasing system permease protein